MAILQFLAEHYCREHLIFKLKVKILLIKLMNSDITIFTSAAVSKHQITDITNIQHTEHY